MKLSTKIIHKVVAFFNAETIFIKAKAIFPSLVKFLPLHTNYKKNQRRVVTRDGVKYNILLSDYMQWYIYANLPDVSWQKASLCVKNNTSIIDVGANSGAFTLKLAQYAFKKNVENFKIYAFEPNPFVYQQLYDNLQLNPHLSDYVSLVMLGLGESAGSFQMSVSNDNSGGGSIVSEAQGEGIEIAITTLDKFIVDEKVENISFVKIDVEGFESFVLRGAKNAVKSCLPSVYIEVTDEWLKKNGSSQHEIINYFGDLQYDLFVENDGKFIPFKKMKDQLAGIYQYNLLAIYNR